MSIWITADTVTVVELDGTIREWHDVTYARTRDALIVRTDIGAELHLHTDDIDTSHTHQEAL